MAIGVSVLVVVGGGSGKQLCLPCQVSCVCVSCVSDIPWSTVQPHR